MVVGISIGIAVVVIPLLLYFVCKYLRKQAMQGDAESGENLEMPKLSAMFHKGHKNVVFVGASSITGKSRRKNRKRRLGSLTKINVKKKITVEDNWIKMKELQEKYDLESRCMDDGIDRGRERDTDSSPEVEATSPKMIHQIRGVSVCNESSFPDKNERRKKFGTVNYQGNGFNELSFNGIAKSDSPPMSYKSVRRQRANTTSDLNQNTNIDEIVASWDELINSTPIGFRKRASTDIVIDQDYPTSPRGRKSNAASPRTGRPTIQQVNRNTLTYTDTRGDCLKRNNKEMFSQSMFYNRSERNEVVEAMRNYADSENVDFPMKSSAKKIDSPRARKLKRFHSFPRMLETKRIDSREVTMDKSMEQTGTEKVRSGSFNQLQSGTEQLETLCQNLEKLSKKC